MKTYFVPAAYVNTVLDNNKTRLIVEHYQTLGVFATKYDAYKVAIATIGKNATVATIQLQH